MDTDIRDTDESIVVRVQGGDGEAFGIIMRRYEPKLLRYGRKFLADPENIQDIVQDVFMRTYESLQSFDASQRFSPWIYRIAHNAFVNELKKRSRSPVALPDFDTWLSHHDAAEDPAEGEREIAEIRAMLEKGLERISPKHKEVLILHYFEELGYKEISDVLQVPIGTVSVRMKRAKEALGVASTELKHSYGKS